MQAMPAQEPKLSYDTDGQGAGSIVTSLMLPLDCLEVSHECHHCALTMSARTCCEGTFQVRSVTVGVCILDLALPCLHCRFDGERPVPNLLDGRGCARIHLAEECLVDGQCGLDGIPLRQVEACISGLIVSYCAVLRQADWAWCKSCSESTP